MRRFRYVTLPDLKLGLDDLLTKRLAPLQSSKVGASYVDMLEHKRGFINALPPALIGGKPLVEELAATDADHDGFGSAIYFVTEAYLRLPNADPQILDAIKRIRAVLIPELDLLRDSYANEAEAAIRRQEALPGLKKDLDLIPVVGGGTLHQWAVEFLGAGQKLDTLLSERADTDTKGRKDAQRLRPETIGLLNRARAAIADERTVSKALSADLDAQIFGYFDDLEETRAAQQKPTKGKGKGEPSGEETPTTGSADHP